MCSVGKPPTRTATRTKNREPPAPRATLPRAWLSMETTVGILVCRIPAFELGPAVRADTTTGWIGPVPTAVAQKPVG